MNRVILGSMLLIVVALGALTASLLSSRLHCVPVLRKAVPRPAWDREPTPLRILVATLYTHVPPPNTLRTVEPLLAALFRLALGVPVAFVPVERVDLADVCVVSQYAPTAELGTSIRNAVARHNATTLFIFIALENPESWEGEDGFVDAVDVSLGAACCNKTASAAVALASPRYLHTPVWLSAALRLEPPPLALATLAASGNSGSAGEPPGSGQSDSELTCQCTLDSRLSDRVDPSAWIARPRFATMIASHGGYPREDLADLLDSVAVDLNSSAPSLGGGWHLDLPGKFRNNMGADALPLGADAKAAWLERYRFNLQPENSRSRTGGYTTEKLVHALAAGAVPVTWGDVPEPRVFNGVRILQLDDSGNGAGGPGLFEPAALAARIRSLEVDALARAAFFAEPVLAPTAADWVREWCSTGSSILRAAIEGHAVVGPRLLHRWRP